MKDLQVIKDLQERFNSLLEDITKAGCVIHNHAEVVGADQFRYTALVEFFKEDDLTRDYLDIHLLNIPQVLFESMYTKANEVFIQNRGTYISQVESYKLLLEDIYNDGIHSDDTFIFKVQNTKIMKELNQTLEDFINSIEVFKITDSTLQFKFSFGNGFVGGITFNKQRLIYINS